MDVEQTTKGHSTDEVANTEPRIILAMRHPSIATDKSVAGHVSVATKISIANIESFTS